MYLHVYLLQVIWKVPVNNHWFCPCYLQVGRYFWANLFEETQNKRFLCLGIKSLRKKENKYTYKGNNFLKQTKIFSFKKHRTSGRGVSEDLESINRRYDDRRKNQKKFSSKRQDNLRKCWIKPLFLRIFFVNGHTTLKAPVLVRSLKLSNVGPG